MRVDFLSVYFGEILNIHPEINIKLQMLLRGYFWSDVQKWQCCDPSPQMVHPEMGNFLVLNGGLILGHYSPILVPVSL